MSNASAIIRATTPTIVCTFPNYIDFSKAELIDVTLAQNAKTLTLHFPDVAAAGNTVEVYLQQHHSARLNSGKAEIQVNWTYPNGARASGSIESITVGRNLHPDVMPAPIYKGRVRRQDATNGQSETTYVSMDVMSNAVSVPMNVESSIVVSGEDGSGTQNVTVDSALSTSSTNPVQNKIIKAALDAKYEKPVDGIPAEDLAAGVRTQLQSIGSAYQKPENGIPETDLAASVVEKLNRVVSGNGVPVGYVTPEMYGAIGDGVNDDGPALKAALKSGERVMLTQDLYLKTNVEVWDKDIYLDGCDHTIWFDGENLSHTSFSAALMFRTHKRDDQLGIVKRHTDPIERIPVEGGECTPYQNGFISYNGRHPIPGVNGYENESVISWDEYTAKIRNLTISCRNCAIYAALDIQKKCYVIVDNVKAICEDGHDGTAGISVAESYHVRINNCLARNWTGKSTQHIINHGYGFTANGDDIIITNCAGENSRSALSCGGSRQYITTGLIVDNFRGYTNWWDEKDSEGSNTLAQVFDLHANALHPIVNNVQICLENQTSKVGIWHMAIRCPEATISNVYAICPSDMGYISCYEFAERITFNNLVAPNSTIYLWDDHESVPLEHLIFDGGRLRSMSIAGDRVVKKLTVRNMEIGSIVRRMRNAEFIGCDFQRQIVWKSQPTIEVSGPCLFRDCTITGNRESGDNKALGFVGLLDGVESAALRFYDCKFVCDPQKAIFRLPVWTQGCWAEDFEGSSFDSDELIPSWIDATLTRHGYAADAAAVGQIPQGGSGQPASVNALGTGKLGSMRLGTRGSSSGGGNSGGGSTATSSALGTGKLGNMKLGTRGTE